MTCSIQGCDRAAKYASTGWCQTHYHRYWRTGSTSILPKVMRDDLTYFGAHGRVKCAFGSATLSPCCQCGRSANEWAYDGTDPSELSGSVNGYPVRYSVWPEFYMPMCFACHRARDARVRFEARTEFGCGHPRSAGNTYLRPGKREASCKTCRKANSAARYLAKKGPACGLKLNFRTEETE